MQYSQQEFKIPVEKMNDFITLSSRQFASSVERRKRSAGKIEKSEILICNSSGMGNHRSSRFEKKIWFGIFPNGKDEIFKWKAGISGDLLSKGSYAAVEAKKYKFNWRLVEIWRLTRVLSLFAGTCLQRGVILKSSGQLLPPK